MSGNRQSGKRERTGLGEQQSREGTKPGREMVEDIFGQLSLLQRAKESVPASLPGLRASFVRRSAIRAVTMAQARKAVKQKMNLFIRLAGLRKSEWAGG